MIILTFCVLKYLCEQLSTPVADSCERRSPGVF